ncbi:MAG: hypothetical protein Fur0041_13200 [Bacteroidia bacterium]
MNTRIHLFVLLWLTSIKIFAQLPAGTDVWLFEVKPYKGKYIPLKGSNISNHQGYDNQPSFSENGSYMLWTSERDSGQTEIYRYTIGNNTTQRLTQTAVSEYSAQYMPGNKFISSVVVEKDSTQRLWKYHKVSGESKLLLPKVYGVGYHTWMNENTLFLFQLTNPVTLVIANTDNGQTKICASNVGRCFQVYRSPKMKMMLYTQTDDSGKVWIRALDAAGNHVKDFKPIPAVNGAQDFAIDKNGTILMAKGSKIYCWKIDESTEWEMMADLSSFGLTDITRIAISPNGTHIAVVNNKE